MGGLIVEFAAAILSGFLLGRWRSPPPVDPFWRSWLQQDRALAICRAVPVLTAAAGLAAVVLAHGLDSRPLADEAVASGLMLGAVGFVAVAALTTIAAATRSDLPRIISVRPEGTLSDLEKRASRKIYSYVRGMKTRQLGVTIKQLMAQADATLAARVVDPYRQRIEAIRKAVDLHDPDSRQEAKGEFHAVCADLIVRLRVPKESL